MEIIERKLEELKPYAKNARVNDDAVEFVANSIREFGFRVPILIEKDGTIVAGHTRYKASKKLHLKSVPCIIVDDLSEEQVKAFRLADNRVAEKSKWNLNLMVEELDDILNLDMSQFGFDFREPDDEPEDKPKKQNERVRTNNGYNLNLFDNHLVEGKFDIPCMVPTKYVPSALLGFNYMKTSLNYDSAIHFFIDDYQFERVWNQPDTYYKMLMMFDGVLTPDFSLYLDMPKVMQIWNVYRSRLLGQWWQNRGLRVVPTVSWSDEASFEFCFDGIPEKSVLAVSTVGVMKDSESLKLFKNGLKELVSRKHPLKLIAYGNRIKEYDYEGCDVVYFGNSVTERMSKGKNKR